MQLPTCFMHFPFNIWKLKTMLSVLYAIPNRFVIVVKLLTEVERLFLFNSKANILIVFHAHLTPLSATITSSSFFLFSHIYTVFHSYSSNNWWELFAGSCTAPNSFYCSCWSKLNFITFLCSFASMLIISLPLQHTAKEAVRQYAWNVYAEYKVQTIWL